MASLSSAPKLGSQNKKILDPPMIRGTFGHLGIEKFSRNVSGREKGLGTRFGTLRDLSGCGSASVEFAVTQNGDYVIIKLNT